MTVPAGPFRPDLDTAVAELALQVDRDTVLQARAALLGEADRLDMLIWREASAHAEIGLCGGDPVSADASAGFNERIAALVGDCQRYCRDLREAAHALDGVARSYGYTEDQIAASFRSGG